MKEFLKNVAIAVIVGLFILWGLYEYLFAMAPTGVPE